MRCRLLVCQLTPYPPTEMTHQRGSEDEFYCAVVQKTVKLFPFDDRVINDLVMLDPNKRDELMHTPIVRLAECFAHLVDQEVIKEEFEYYQLMGTLRSAWKKVVYRNLLTATRVKS